MALEKAFKVLVDGVNNPVREVDVGGSNVTLIVTDTIDFGDDIKVSYTKPDTSQITDLNGNDLDSFVDKVVDNSVLDPNDADPPIFDGAETDQFGTEISISFDEDIVAAIPPNPVVNLSELETGEDTANENRYYIIWRWSPGDESNDNPRDYYEYRFRQVASPVNAWSNYARLTAGQIRIGNLLPNAQYEIEVRAVNNGGTSDGLVDQADTPTVQAGKPPVSFRITNRGRKLDGSTYKYFMNLAYERDASDTDPITRYEYRFKESTSDTWGGWVNNSLTETFSIDTLKRNTQYDFEVRTINFIGASVAATVQGTVTFNTPNTPDNFTATPSRGGDSTNGWTYQIALSWQKPADDNTNTVDGFRYRYKLSTADSFGSWVTVSKTTVSATITGLTHTVLYDIELEATNNEGSSTVQKQENILIFQVPGGVDSLAGVTSNAGTVDTPNLQIQWTWALPTVDSTNTIDDVQVRTREISNAWGSTAFVSKGAAATSHSINMLSEGTYEIEVKVINSAGDSEVSSNQVKITVLIEGPSLEVNAQGTNPRGSFNLVAVPGIANASSNDDVPDTLGYFELEYHAPGVTAWSTWSGSNKSADSPDGRFWMSASNFDVFSPTLSNGNFSLGQGLTTFVGYSARCRMINTDGSILSKWTEAVAS